MPLLGEVELRTQLLDKVIAPMLFQYRVQLLVEWIPCSPQPVVSMKISSCLPRSRRPIAIVEFPLPSGLSSFHTTMTATNARALSDVTFTTG